MFYLQHEMEICYFLCRPAAVVIPNFKPWLHALNVGTFFKKILIGIVILQQVL